MTLNGDSLTKENNAYLQEYSFPFRIWFCGCGALDLRHEKPYYTKFHDSHTNHYSFRECKVGYDKFASKIWEGIPFR